MAWNRPKGLKGLDLARWVRSICLVDGNGCWIWPRYIAKSGYGALTIDGSVHNVHRVTYEAFIGAIPDGLQIDHLCRVRECCNPEHLEAVTPAENSSRGMAAMRTHCPRGHAYDESNTRIRKRTGWRDCRACHRDRERSLYHLRKSA